MPNGKPGDHPVTDILVHKRRAFSAKIDSLIEKIVQLGGQKELESKFNFFKPPAHSEFEQSLRELHDRLLKEAKERGWEI